MVETYNELKFLLANNASEGDKNVAKAYWLASLNIGVNASEYVTDNVTFKSFLVKNDIMTDDEEFIETEDFEEDFEEETEL